MWFGLVTQSDTEVLFFALRLNHITIIVFISIKF